MARRSKTMGCRNFELISSVKIPIQGYLTTSSFDVDLYDDQIAVLIEDKVFIYQ
jgi:hypothetical protein